MTYELFQQGPAAYIPIILISLVVTLVAYGAFPLIFARVRKKVVTKKKYNWLCYGINFLVMIVFFTVMNGEPGNAAPYLLWTWVFSASGLKTLKNRGVLDGFQPVDYTKAATYQAGQVMGSDIALETSQETDATTIDPQPEVAQEETLMSRAYSSYVSTDPEEKRFFEDLLGSEELKAAYMEECERNQREYDKGVRINYKQSYLQFMGVLHDEYFGTPQTPYEEPTPTAEPVTPVSAPVIEKTAVQNHNEKHTFCKKCGSAIDPNTKKCGGCGKQYFNPKKTVPITLLSILLVASIGLNVMQYFQGKEDIETVATQATKIEKLEKEVSTQKSTISSQKTKIASLEKKGGYFDKICEELSSGNIGYAASNFRASESVIIVDKNETNRKFTLTANWTNGGTVSVDYSGSAAWVDFDNESWTTSTKMSIEPWQEGVTAVTFSNDVDSRTFKVIIIVT